MYTLYIWYIWYTVQYSRCKNKTKRWGQAKKEAPGVRSRWRLNTCAINKWLKRYLGLPLNSNLNWSTAISQLGSTCSHGYGITRQYSGWSAWEIIFLLVIYPIDSVLFFFSFSFLLLFFSCDSFFLIVFLIISTVSSFFFDLSFFSFHHRLTINPLPRNSHTKKTPWAVMLAPVWQLDYINAVPCLSSTFPFIDPLNPGFSSFLRERIPLSSLSSLLENLPPPQTSKTPCLRQSI